MAAPSASGSGSRPPPPSDLPTPGAATRHGRSKAARVFLALAAIVGCNAVGLLGALVTSTDTAWYQSLEKPAFQPPGYVFGPVWTILYTAMGIALFRVIERSEHPGARGAIVAFAIQLALNGIWSPTFFGFQAVGAALVVIAALLVALSLTTKRFLAVDRVAGLLLLPYLAWVAFATVLTASILALNG